MIEGLALFSWFDDPEGNLRVLEARENSVMGELEGRIIRVDENLCLVAFCCHSLVLLWAFADLWTLQRKYFHPEGKIPSDSLSGVLWLLMEIGFFGWLLGLGFVAYFLANSFRLISPGNFIRVVAWVYIGYCVWLIRTLSEPIWMGFGWMVLDLTFLTGTIGSILLWSFCLNFFCLKFPRVARTFLLISDDSADSDQRINLAFSFFLYTLVICILWYGLRYDAEGTVNPSWTGIFG